MRLEGAPVHRRAWRLSAHSLEIVDEVQPARPAEARFIVHPDIPVAVSETATFQLGQVKLSVKEGGGQLVVADHSARFGEKRQTEAVLVLLNAGHSRVNLSW
jgi:hypothetical protein